MGSWVGTTLPAQSQAADSLVFLRHANPAATDQVIVKWRDSGVAAAQLPTIQERTERLRSTTGADVRPVHNLYGQIDVLQLDHAMAPGSMGTVLAQLRADPGVEYAEPDGWRYIAATLDSRSQRSAFCRRLG